MFSLFSALDDRARAKGSRDPLGAEASWSFLGRRLVGNLTTVTGNLDNFMVALLCCAHANHDAPEPGQGRARYLAAEQLAAYLRLEGGAQTQGLLGITQARKNIGQAQIALGTSAKAQLLASQAAYGLWGLYSTAMDGAGLIAGPQRSLTAAGAALLDRIVQQFGPAHWQTFCNLARGTTVSKPMLQKDGLATAFVAMLKAPALRVEVVRALLESQRDCALQSELFVLAQDFARQSPVGVALNSRDFCAWLLRHADASDALRTVLQRIVSLDPLLKLADIVMSWLQKKNAVALEEVAAQLQDKLGARDWGLAWQQETNLPNRALLLKLHAAVAAGDAAAIIDAILAQNRSLMMARGGAAWIEVQQGKLMVRMPNEGAAGLRGLAGLDNAWRYTYFIDAFLSITQQGQACNP